MEKPISLLEFAYDKIKEQILSGEYAPGQKLSAKDISEELGISQTPVKEAINRLVAEGFVDSIPRKGQTVRRMTVEDVRDMIYVRIMMESFAAEYAAQNLHKYPEILKRMQELLDVYDQAPTLSYLEVSRLEHEYHNLFIQLTGNKRLIQLYQTDWSVGLMYYLYASTDFPLTELSTEFASHREQFNLLLAGEVEKVKEITKKTMNTVLVKLMQLMARDKKGVFLR